MCADILNIITNAFLCLCMHVHIHICMYTLYMWLVGMFLLSRVCKLLFQLPPLQQHPPSHIRYSGVCFAYICIYIYLYMYTYIYIIYMYVCVCASGAGQLKTPPHTSRIRRLYKYATIKYRRGIWSAKMWLAIGILIWETACERQRKRKRKHPHIYIKQLCIINYTYS